MPHTLRMIETPGPQLAFYECSCGSGGQANTKGLSVKEAVLRALKNFEAHKRRAESWEPS